MMGHKQRAVLRRFLAAGLSLVLIVASVIGMQSHAGHNEHHHPGAPAADIRIAHVAELAADQAPTADGEYGSTTGDNHGTCNDMVCHGGFAVLTVASDVAPFRQAMCCLWADQTGRHTATLSLDRPPKALVRA